MEKGPVSTGARSCDGCYGCNTGSQPQGENAAATETAEVSDDIVNIGVTNTLGTLNPLLMDGGR